MEINSSFCIERNHNFIKSHHGALLRDAQQAAGAATLRDAAELRDEM